MKIKPNYLSTALALLAACQASQAQALINQEAIRLGDRPSSQIICANNSILYVDPIDAVSLNGGHAIGWGSKADGTHSLAFGNATEAEGIRSIAIGGCSRSSYVVDPRFGSGDYGSAMALGWHASSIGQLNLAIGDYANVNGGFRNIAFGSFATVQNSFESASLGGFISDSDRSTSVGVGSAVIAGAHGAIAIGHDSLANGPAEAYTVSFGMTARPEWGNPGFTRRLINIGDGVNATDAATVGQVQQATDAVLTTSSVRLGEATAGIYSRITSTDAQLAGALADLTATNVRLSSIQSSLTTLTADGSVTSARIEGIAVDAKATAAVAAATAGEALSLGKANSEKLAQHETILTEHDQRISTAQSTADDAYSTAEAAQTTASRAISLTTKLNSRMDYFDGRLRTVEEQVGQLDGRVGSLEQSVERDRSEARAGIASVAAMSMPTPSLSAGERALVVGLGNFKGQSALAAGLVYAPRSGALLSMRLGTSRTGTALSAGASVKF